jgi:hypothetical protein
MKTILKNKDCILHSEYTPIEKAQDNEEVLHRNTVEAITIYKDKYDYNGDYISTEKIFIDKYFLSDIRKAIEEIEKDEKIMPFSMLLL